MKRRKITQTSRERFPVTVKSDRQERDEGKMRWLVSVWTVWDWSSQLCLVLFMLHLITMNQTEAQTNGGKHIVFCWKMAVQRPGQGAGLPILPSVTDRSGADWYPGLGGDGALWLATGERRCIQVDRGHRRCRAAALWMCERTWRGKTESFEFRLTDLTLSIRQWSCCVQLYLCQIQWSEDNEWGGS